MIYDQDFKIISYGGGPQVFIKLENNTINIVSNFLDEEFKILYTDDLLTSTVYQSIFEYYKIKIKKSIIWKQAPSDIAEYFKKYYSDEILIFNSFDQYIIYIIYSDICSDKLLTTIELIGI